MTDRPSVLARPYAQRLISRQPSHRMAPRVPRTKRAACTAFQIALSSQTAAAEPMQAAAFTGTCIINIQPKGGSERANTDALAASVNLTST